VTQAGSGSNSYTYDANGNAHTRNGTIIGWTSYNYPSSVGTSTESASFDYGPDRQRWRMIYNSPSGTERTYYPTPMFERVDTSTGSDYRHYIYAAGRPVAVVSRTTAGTTTARALFADRQGSISSIITDSTGTALVNESFTAYGNRREASTWNGAPTSTERTAMDGVTRQGYTFQTVLGSMGLNHMNGRVEDAITGRFLSPDPNVPDPGNTQSYNRYSYVNNNPLSQIDPTGFENISGARDQWARDAKYGKTLAIRQTAAFMIFSFSLTDWYAQAAGAFGLGGDGGGGGALYVTGTDSNGFAISQ
jgi:RHS repeat-associated protein